MAASDETPISAWNLKSLMGGGFFGGTLLFESSSGATSGTLSRSADGFSHLLVTAKMALYYGTMTLSVLVRPGETIPLGSSPQFSTCTMSVSGTSFKVTGASEGQRVLTIVGFNF